MTREKLERIGVPFKDLPAGPPPSRVKLKVEYFVRGTRQHRLVGPDGSEVTLGVPLDQLRKRLAGNNGIITDPWGGSHELELPSPVKDAEDVFASISFEVSDH